MQEVRPLTAMLITTHSINLRTRGVNNHNTVNKLCLLCEIYIDSTCWHFKLTWVLWIWLDYFIFPRWRHQMKTFSALLTFCEGNSPVTGEFPAQRPVTWRFDVFFDLRLNKSWVNNREAGDLRRLQAHYDVIVMSISHWRNPYSF